jgi:hypothetical protein
MRVIASLTSESRLLHFLRTILLLIAIGGMLGVSGLHRSAYAQTQGPSLQSTQRPVRVALDPTYQYYETEDGQVLTEFTTRLSAFVPINQRLDLRAQVDYAQMGGNDLESVQGPTDVAVTATYAQPVGEGSVVFALKSNVPTGKQRLATGDGSQLETNRLISRNFYDFRVSSFSRGFSVSPKVTWAYPISDQLAVGLGGGYQLQRGFQPNDQFTSDSLYVPGNGISVNAGVDYKITDASAFGVDISFRRYGADEVGGAPLFEAGNRIGGTLRYLRRSGFTTIRAVMGYTQWEESQFGFRAGSPTQGQVLPPHGLALVSYRTRLSETIRLHARASGHWYGETVKEGTRGNQKMFGRAYLSPSFDVADVLSLEPHTTISYGSYLGVGGGLRVVGTF